MIDEIFYTDEHGKCRVLNAGIDAPAHRSIDPHKQYSPAEVARILNVSYDTAIRRMKDMKGCIDLGSKETRHKRPKAKLRVSGKHLQAYLRDHSL